jgi:hypothetical protein
MNCDPKLFESHLVSHRSVQMKVMAMVVFVSFVLAVNLSCSFSRLPRSPLDLVERVAGAHAAVLWVLAYDAHLRVQLALATVLSLGAAR